MALIVQKFGGTSVANPEAIKTVARRIIETRTLGHQLIVVVSAMAGETDRLLNLASEFSTSPVQREVDALLATGEQVSTALLTIALNESGCAAQSLNAYQAGIHTNNQFGKARIQQINCDAIRAKLNEDKVLVVAGFQGVDENLNITTLGRGGTDTTAVAFAAALKAEECQIFTDVDGVYSSDPRIVPSAHRLEEVTYDEMLELSSLGAKVLQHRAVELAGRHNIDLRVLSTFGDGPGTKVAFNKTPLECPLVTGIAHKDNEAKITLTGLEDKPGLAGRLLTLLGEEGIEVDMLVQNKANEQKTSFIFSLPEVSAPQALNVLEMAQNSLNFENLETNSGLSKITLVGSGLRSHPEVAQTMFNTLGDRAVNIETISTSETKLSVLISSSQMVEALRALHTAFQLD